MNMAMSPVDPDGLMEFSVVFTDRSLNHMSKAFQGVMNDSNSLGFLWISCPTVLSSISSGKHSRT